MFKDNIEIWIRAYDNHNKPNSVESKKRVLIMTFLLCGLAGLSIILLSLPKLTAQNPPETSSEQQVVPEIKAVTALGRLEPKGEVISVAAPPTLGGAKVITLSVKEGDLVRQNQVLALLDNHSLQKATLDVANKEVELQKSNLAIVKAGAKEGEINAQKATIERLKVELKSENTSNQAKIARWQAQLAGDKKSLSATLQRLKAEYNNADLEFKRYEALARDGAISTSELDQRRLTLETAQERVLEAEANLSRTIATLEQDIKETQADAQKTTQSMTMQIKEAEANLEKISEVRDVEVKEAQAELNKAIASYQEAQQYLALTEIRAPSPGRVLKINTRPGESINEDDGILELGQTEQMMVIAEVYESDISGVKLGQEVIITSEGGAFSSELKGTVAEVGWQIGKNDVLDTDPAADVDKRVIEVKIALDPESSNQVQNLTYSQVLVKILL